MLAVAKWIGDWDCLGKNCGYILEEDVAVVYKVDVSIGNGLDEKTPTKDIPVAPSKNITFDSIFPSDKNLFLQKISEILNFTDEDINNITTYVTSDNLPPAINLTLKDTEFWSNQRQFLCKQRENLRTLYHKDLTSESYLNL